MMLGYQSVCVSFFRLSAPSCICWNLDISQIPFDLFLAILQSTPDEGIGVEPAEEDEEVPVASSLVTQPISPAAEGTEDDVRQTNILAQLIGIIA